MHRPSLAPFLDARDTFDDTWRDDMARDELRGRLLTAADEEAAAIVEDTRQQILLTVRRARRDLLRVQTQLQFHNLESLGPQPEAPDSIAVRHTTALRQIAREAATELELLSTIRPALAVSDVTVNEVTVNDVTMNGVTEFATEDYQARPIAWPAPFPTVSRPQLIVAAVVAALVVIGLVGMAYRGVKARSAAPPRTQAAATPARAVPDRSPAPASTNTGPAKTVASARPAAREQREAPAARRDEAATPAAPVAPPPSIVKAASDATAPEPPGDAPAPAAGDDPQATIFAKHVQWIDAYGRNDRQAMAGVTTAGFSLRDERAARSANADAGGSTPAQVTDVHIDVAGPGAVLTARLRSSAGGVTSESMLSEVWVRGEQQQWSLMGVRITPVDRVPQPGTR